MITMSSLLASMSDAQRQEYYLACASVALAQYALGPISIHFVQHNAGIVYRLDDANGEACFLLKIHESAGDGSVDTPAQLTAQMAWLHALTEDGRVIVQSPIANWQGEFVTKVGMVQCPTSWVTNCHSCAGRNPRCASMDSCLRRNDSTQIVTRNFSVSEPCRKILSTVCR